MEDPFIIKKNLKKDPIQFSNIFVYSNHGSRNNRYRNNGNLFSTWPLGYGAGQNVNPSKLIK